MECPYCGLSYKNYQKKCLRCGLIFDGAGRSEGRSVSRSAGSRIQEPLSPGSGEMAQDSPVIPEDALSPDDGKGALIGRSENKRAGQYVRIPWHDRSAVIEAQPRHDSLTDSQQFRANGQTNEHAEEPTTEECAEFPAEPRRLDGEDWLIMACGPVIALMILWSPFLTHIFLTLTTVIHEMGHALTGWIFGYPAVPAFDIQYGGGVTATMPRSALLLIVFYGLMCALIYTYRKNRLTLMVLSAFLALHVVLSATRLHYIVFLMMGHGMELVIAGIFFYRALSGAAVAHWVERPLYCVISWFIVFSDLRFAYRLVTSAHERRLYEAAKGGGHWMDLSRVAEAYLSTDLRTVAAFFFVCALLPLVMGYLAFRYQEYLRELIVRLWKRDPDDRECRSA